MTTIPSTMKISETPSNHPPDCFATSSGFYSETSLAFSGLVFSLLVCLTSGFEVASAFRFASASSANRFVSIFYLSKASELAFSSSSRRALSAAISTRMASWAFLRESILASSKAFYAAAATSRAFFSSAKI